MPEATKDAAVLIAASYQALNRALSTNPQTQLCDCTVTIAFAGFYIEANLNHLIAELRREADLKTWGSTSNPGLKTKLAFFYNEYVASAPLPPQKAKDVYDKLEGEFPGMSELAEFRNNICHGTMDRTAAQSLPTTLRLRNQAKHIVERLFTIASQKTGRDLRRTLVTYWDAIGITLPTQAVTPHMGEVRLSPTTDWPTSDIGELRISPDGPTSE